VRRQLRSWALALFALQILLLKLAADNGNVIAGGARSLGLRGILPAAMLLGVPGNPYPRLAGQAFGATAISTSSLYSGRAHGHPNLPFSPSAAASGRDVRCLCDPPPTGSLAPATPCRARTVNRQSRRPTAPPVWSAPLITCSKHLLCSLLLGCCSTYSGPEHDLHRDPRRGSPRARVGAYVRPMHFGLRPGRSLIWAIGLGATVADAGWRALF